MTAERQTVVTALEARIKEDIRDSSTGGSAAG
jgi:hypothetical protein